jgi:hypothetical protein
MFGKLLLALTSPVLFVACGCSNNYVREPIEPRQDVYHADDRAQLFFDSTNLRNDTAADTPSVFRDQNGLLHVTVPIRSVINKQLYVEFRVIFFDRDHHEIDRSPWRDKTLPANLPESVSITSTTPRAESFQVHFRYPTGSEM